MYYFSSIYNGAGLKGVTISKQHLPLLMALKVKSKSIQFFLTTIAINLSCQLWFYDWKSVVTQQSPLKKKRPDHLVLTRFHYLFLCDLAISCCALVLGYCYAKAEVLAICHSSIYLRYRLGCPLLARDFHPFTGNIITPLPLPGC